MKIDHINVTPLFLPFKVPYHWAGRLHLGACVALVEVSTYETRRERAADLIVLGPHERTLPPRSRRNIGLR